MRLNKYIIQEKLCNLTWLDVYETYDRELAVKFCKVLCGKHLDKTYRIVKGV